MTALSPSMEVITDSGHTSLPDPASLSQLGATVWQFVESQCWDGETGAVNTQGAHINIVGTRGSIYK